MLRRREVPCLARWTLPATGCVHFGVLQKTHSRSTDRGAIFLDGDGLCRKGCKIAPRLSLKLLICALRYSSGLEDGSKFYILKRVISYLHCSITVLPKHTNLKENI